MMRIPFAAGVVTLLACRHVAAQPQPPFFGGGVAAFDPEPAVVQSGALNEVQATVSHDRRYVTISVNQNNSRLRDLALFPVQATNFGFVGGLNPGGDPGFDPGAGPSMPSRSPTAIANRASILNRRGIFLIATLD